jgi:hypothetical protein
MANRGPYRWPGTAMRAPQAFVRTAMLAGLGGALLGLQPVQAQKLKSLPTDPSAVSPPQLKDHFLADRLPEKPAVPPFAKIPLDSLNFAAPNPIYLGHRFTMASLDFLDEDHLLFTFRIPGLIRRAPGEEGEDDRHTIRAVVLSIHSGAIDARATWVLHGRDRYIWPLKGGGFLLRDGRVLSAGDARLRIKPYLSFPGPLLDIGMDPDDQYLVTNSREPAPAGAKTSTPDEGSVDDQNSGAPDVVLRVFRRASGDVLNVTRVHAVTRIPLDSQGLLEALKRYSNQWSINLNQFTGGKRQVARVISQCMPRLDFVSNGELLATTCKPEGGFGLIGIATSGQLLWQDSTSQYSVWPILRRSETGLRFLRESLAVTREIGTTWALDRSDVKAQRVRVFNAADGTVAFEATADPVLDAGGNAAISPSGRRVAMLSNGHIQIFNLPSPPALPAAVGRAAAK